MGKWKGKGKGRGGKGGKGGKGKEFMVVSGECDLRLRFREGSRNHVPSLSLLL